MAKKSAYKKKAPKVAHPGDTFTMPAPKPPKPRREASIKKATNGFVVSSWGEGDEKLYIAKTEEEAQKLASKLLKF